MSVAVLNPTPTRSPVARENDTLAVKPAAVGSAAATKGSSNPSNPVPISAPANGAIALPIIVPSASGTAPPPPSEAELEYLKEQSLRLEAASPREIIAWAVENYFPSLTMATAFGPEGCVIIHFLAEIEPRTHVFNLDTGYQFKETLELRDRLAARYRISGLDERHPPRPELRPGQGGDRRLGQEIRPGEDQPAGQLD
jgi:phosphoadenosine phosphosulfate reductase